MFSSGGTRAHHAAECCGAELWRSSGGVCRYLPCATTTGRRRPIRRNRNRSPHRQNPTPLATAHRPVTCATSTSMSVLPPLCLDVWVRQPAQQRSKCKTNMYKIAETTWASVWRSTCTADASSKVWTSGAPTCQLRTRKQTKKKTAAIYCLSRASSRCKWKLILSFYRYGTQQGNRSFSR